MSYQAWEVEQALSPSSPEAYYAELAWNAALETLKDCLIEQEHTGRAEPIIDELRTSFSPEP